MKVFVENQPKKSLMSIIVINTPKIDNRVHENIIKLKEISDLFFIFGKESKGINPRRFTTLYEGCSWIREDNLVRAFLCSVKYSKYIFSCHTGYLLSENLSSQIDSDGIMKLHMFGNTLPVLEIERKSLDKIRALYEVKDKGLLWWKKEYTQDQFSTYSTPSWAIYFKSLPIATEDSWWVDTFNPEHVMTFFANSVKRSGLDNINQTVGNETERTK